MLRRSWAYSLDIKQFLSDDTSDRNAAEVANKIAAELRAKLPESVIDDDMDLADILDELDSFVPANCGDGDSENLCGDLNRVLEDLYDWADRERVWLGL